MSYFIQGLKSIANILLAAESLPSIDENGTVADQVQTNMTIFGLTDFVIQADELFDTNDLSAQQYATLLNAIFSGHSSVQSLFDLYHNPDFLLAVDADEDLRESLCSRDLLHLGKKLEPLSPTEEEEQDDHLLKWAIKTSLHNFAATLSAELPQDFVNIIYHMFSSGDEMVLTACQKFVDAHVCGAEMESDAVEDMLFREYSIYERNRAFREELSSNVSEEDTSVTEPSKSLVESSLYKASPEDEDNKDFPDCLLTAVACLVDRKSFTEHTAATILASYAKGHSLLHDIYDHFIEFGGVDDFLSMVSKCISLLSCLVRGFNYSIAHFISLHIHLS